ERRTRTDNLRVAVERLRLNLALAVRGPAPAGPSAKWVARVRDGRLVLSATHADFPALLAQALDVLAAHEQAGTPAPPWRGGRPTRPGKLRARGRRGLAALNAGGSSRGLRALKD